jgi:hypothetical protein
MLMVIQVCRYAVCRMPLTEDKCVEKVKGRGHYLTLRLFPFLGGAADVILLVCINSPIYLREC